MIRGQLLCFVFVTVISGILCKVNEDATTGTKCLKDEALKDYPMNVYYCDDEAFPTCCQRDFNYDCCEDETSKTWKEQLILWGGVSAAIVLIMVVCLCFWKEDLCKCKSPCKKWKEKRDAQKFEEKKPLDDADAAESNRNTPLPGSYENPAMSDNQKSGENPSNQSQQPPKA